MYEIPIFPLHTVLFPGMPLTLQIFEPRYLSMLQRVIAGNRTFGVTLIRRGEEAMGPLPEPYLVGCTARLLQVEGNQEVEGEGTTITISVMGDERFRVVHLAEVNEYYTGFVETMPLERPASLTVSRAAAQLHQQIGKYLLMLSRIAEHKPLHGRDALAEARLREMNFPDDPLLLTYLSAALLQISPHEKQPLLEAATAADLIHATLRLVRRELTILPALMQVDEDRASELSAWN